MAVRAQSVYRDETSDHRSCVEARYDQELATITSLTLDHDHVVTLKNSVTCTAQELDWLSSHLTQIADRMKELEDVS